MATVLTGQKAQPRSWAPDAYERGLAAGAFGRMLGSWLFA